MSKAGKQDAFTGLDGHETVDPNVTRIGGLHAMATVRDLCEARSMPHTCDDGWGGDILAAACVQIGATVSPRLNEGVWIAAPYIEGHYDENNGVSVEEGHKASERARPGSCSAGILLWHSSGILWLIDSERGIFSPTSDRNYANASRPRARLQGLVELAQRGNRIINGRAKIIVQTSALLPHEQEGEELRCPPDFRDGSPERLAGRLSFTPRGV
nr:enolase C-terminal domain-like protein [Mesorhizobium muleiense]